MADWRLVGCGIVGATETSALSLLAAELASKRVMDSAGLLLFCLTVPVGAVLGTVVGGAITTPDDRLDSSPTPQAEPLAAGLGCLPSWMVCMMVAFAPLAVSLPLLAAAPLIAASVLSVRLFERRRRRAQAKG